MRKLVTLCIVAAFTLSQPAIAARIGSLEISAANVTDILGNVRGGLSRDMRILDRLDLTATYAGDEHGLPGFSVFADVQLTDGPSFSGNVVGDAQGVSSVDGPAGVRLANAWVAREFNGRGGIKAGILDLNTEFDVQATGALFLNSAFGIGPDFSQSGLNGPSIFPSTGFGAAAWWLPAGHWQVKAGLFEGTPGVAAHPGRTAFDFSRDEGLLLVLEAHNHITPGFKLGAGTWRYTASFDSLDTTGTRTGGNSGFYAIADGKLYDAPQGEDTGLSGWVRLGFADDRFNAMDFSAGGGLVYTGPFGRMADQAGISFARAEFGAPARKAAFDAGGALGPAETVLEATYAFGINDHLTVQPDLQYVFSPSGDPSVGDALVIGSRFTASW